MSREVCGICWCPYDEDTGECACKPEPKAQHMTTLRTAAQQALEAWDGGDTEWFKRAYTVMENLRAALAEPVQEPVGEVVAIDFSEESGPEAIVTLHQDVELGTMLYAAPPQRKPMNEFDALRLITESIGSLQSAGPVEGLIGIIRAVERAHNIT